MKARKGQPFANCAHSDCAAFLTFGNVLLARAARGRDVLTRKAFFFVFKGQTNKAILASRTTNTSNGKRMNGLCAVFPRSNFDFHCSLDRL